MFDSVWLAGFDEALAGGPRSYNPYEEPELQKRWDAGWLAGDMENQRRFEDLDCHWENDEL